MKKYTLITTTIFLFFASQLVSMDRKPSTANLKAFKSAVANKLSSIKHRFLTGAAQFPIFNHHYIINNNLLGELIRDNAQKYGINRETARDILATVIMDCILQYAVAKAPKTENYQALQTICYDIYYPTAARTAHEVFFDYLPN